MPASAPAHRSVQRLTANRPTEPVLRLRPADDGWVCTTSWQLNGVFQSCGRSTLLLNNNWIVLTCHDSKLYFKTKIHTRTLFVWSMTCGFHTLWLTAIAGFCVDKIPVTQSWNTDVFATLCFLVSSVWRLKIVRGAQDRKVAKCTRILYIDLLFNNPNLIIFLFLNAHKWQQNKLKFSLDWISNVTPTVWPPSIYKSKEAATFIPVTSCHVWTKKEKMLQSVVMISDSRLDVPLETCSWRLLTLPGTSPAAFAGTGSQQQFHCRHWFVVISASVQHQWSFLRRTIRWRLVHAHVQF